MALNMDESRLETLKKKLATIDEAVSREELTQAIEALLIFSKKLGDKTENELAMIAEAVTKAIERIKSTSDKSLASLEKELTEKAESLMNDIRFEKEAFLAEAQAKIDAVKDGEPGKDADEDAVVEKVLSLIPPVKELEPETPESVRDKLETLEGEERLKIEAIHKLREELDRLEKKILEERRVIGGSHTVGVLDEGATVTPNARWLNFTGAGVSISTQGDQVIVSITGGGAGSTTPAQESGTITDLTNIITLADTPVAGTLMLYINEGFIDPNRYSLVGDTITMSSALDGSYSGLRFTAIYQY
jgi:hypothetical protein